MSRLLRALEKAGLVELDARSSEATESEEHTPEQAWSGTDAETTEDENPSPAPADDAAEQQTQAANTTPGAEANGPSWGRPLEEIYAENAVRPSPFPAEKLLKLLDGLRMLEPNARKAAVLALDAADEAWTIDDALLDAEHKLRALRQAQTGMQQQLQTLTQRASDDLAEREAQQQQRSAQIRKQISELESLLEREIARASEDRAAIQNHLQQQQQQAQQEQNRLEQECARLQELASIFASENHSTT